jgi:hypothetical protein
MLDARAALKLAEQAGEIQAKVGRNAGVLADRQRALQQEIVDGAHGHFTTGG